MHHIDYGVGILTKRALMLVPDNDVYDLASLYQQFLKNQQLSAYQVHERFYEIGSLAGIKELDYYLSQEW